ncbi:hypothetical protein LTS18_001685, partial [Coniosporium uncinatum]
IQAFLPRPEAENSKISNKGAFVSVDSRPVSSSRGLLKQIVVKFRNNLKRASPQLDGVKDPFLCLNIICPEDSYDPNIEPAKDGVLFHDGSKLLEAAGKLLDIIYPTGDLLSTAQDHVAELDPPPAETSMVGTSEACPQAETRGQGLHRDERALKRRGTVWRSIYGCNKDDLELMEDGPDEVPSEQGDTEEDLRNIEISNPWTIAKMNAPVRRQDFRSNLLQRPPTPENDGADRVLYSFPVPQSQAHRQSGLPMLPTPHASSSANVSSGDFQFHEILDSRRSNLSRHPRHTHSSITAASDLDPDTGYSRNSFTTASHLPTGSPLKAMPNSSQRKQYRGAGTPQRGDRINKPIKPPGPDKPMVWFENPSIRRRRPQLQQTGINLRNTAPNRMPLPATNFASSVIDDDPGGREHAFTPINPPEGRSVVSSYCSGTEARPHELLPTPEFPRHDLNPELSNPAGPTDDVQHTGADGTTCASYPLDEGLAPPPRRRRTIDGLHRTKSALLPLERVPAGYHLQDTVLHCTTTAEQIKASLRRLDTVSNYVGWNTDPCVAYNGLEVQYRREQVQAWAARLVSIMKQRDLNFEPSEDFEDVVTTAVEDFFKVAEETDVELAV